jgi:hypothetical protein
MPLARYRDLRSHPNDFAPGPDHVVKLRRGVFTMRELLKKLIQDESGVIVSSEIVLVGTILVIGCIVGLTSVSYAVNNELNDVAQACDHSYNGPGANGTQDNYNLTSSNGEPELAGDGG